MARFLVLVFVPFREALWAHEHYHNSRASVAEWNAMKDDDSPDLTRALRDANFKLNQKVAQMESLYDAWLAMSGSLDVEAVVGELLQLAVATVDARAGFLFVKSEKGQRFQLVEHMNLKFRQVKLLREDPLRRTIRRVVRKGSCLALGPDMLPRGFGARHMLLAPVGNLGFLGVVDKETREGIEPFGEADEHLLELMGQQAGMALSNARLYRRVEEEKNLGLNILASVASGVISTDRDGRILRVNPAAGRVLSDAGDLVGKSCVHLLQTWGYGAISAAARDTLEDGREREVRNEEGAKTGLTLSARTSPLRDQDGATEGIVIALEDITERSRLRTMFQQYVSDQVVEQIMAADTQPVLGGQLCEATMLFVDVVGSTQLLGQIGAQEMVRVINDCFTSMVEIVFTHHGTLDKYTGDGFMAVYGAPVSQGDDSRRAVQSALEIVEEIKRLNRRAKQELAISIGISRGEVVAGNIGSPRRMEYSVIGDDVVLASRLCERARADEILVTPKVRRELEGLFGFEFGGRQLFKGMREPMDVYRAVSLEDWDEEPERPPETAAEKAHEAHVSLGIPMMPNMELTAARTASAVAGFMELPPDKLQEVEAALVEACINAFEHSQSKDRRLDIDFRTGEDRLTIVITDRGHGFDVQEALDEIKARRARGEQRRGWGLSLMGEFMDEMDVVADANGTALTMVKYR